MLAKGCDVEAALAELKIERVDESALVALVAGAARRQSQDGRRHPRRQAASRRRPHRPGEEAEPQRRPQPRPRAGDRTRSAGWRVISLNRRSGGACVEFIARTEHGPASSLGLPRAFGDGEPRRHGLAKRRCNVYSQIAGLRVASAMFALLGVVQLMRLALRPEVLVAGHVMPLWPSVVAVIVLGALSAWMWRLSRPESHAVGRP